jgi:2-dehydro-3-deoxyphosphogluconate aldolase / (4S)-4-hydroxy-2-oxoglutarate aldolase
VSTVTQLRDALAADRVMAILRYRGGGDVLGAIEALHRGGVRVLEVTVDTPGCWDAIAAAARQPDLVVGAGTVTTAEQARHVADLGARFVVSPGLDVDVLVAAHERGLATLPGVATGTEVLAAQRAGADVLKFFPAGGLGPRYLAELRGPFGGVDFVPTGGIRVDEVGAWLQAGALAVAFGSDLAGRQAPASAQEVDALATRAGLALRFARGEPAP